MMNRALRRLAPGMIVVAMLLVAGQRLFAADSRDVVLRRNLANGMSDFAEWCLGKKLVAEGRGWVEEALGLDPENKRAKALQPKLAGDSTASDTARKEYATRLKTASSQIAKLYRDLFAVKHAAKDQAQWDVWLLRAYELDEKGTGGVVDSEWREAQRKSDWERAQRLLLGAQKVRKDDKRAKVLDDLQLKIGETTPILRKAANHAMEYYLVLPKGWSKARRWPILVTVEGAGCNWLGNCQGFLGGRKDLPFIIVTPIAFSNTNALDPKKYNYPKELLDEVERTGRMKFDEEGLLEVLKDVREKFGGEDKFWITGFSGGGMLTWRMVFGHPDLLNGAAPACGNFAMPGEISGAPERETVPIKAFQGDKDEYWKDEAHNLENQWLSAKSICDAHGFKNVKRVIVPGAGHSACVQEVWEFVGGTGKK